MIRSRQGAVADTVSIHVLVAGKPAEPIEIFLAQDLTALDRSVGIPEWIRHPVVHTQVEIGHDEHERLEMFCQIEGVSGHRETLFDRRWNQQNMLGVAVRKKRRREDVTLRRTRGQTRRGSDPLDIPHHSRNFGVVGQTSKLAHQGDSRTGSRGHSARACPARPQHHPDSRQLVFRLHNGEACFAVRPDAVFLHVIDEGFHERGRGGDRIPGHHGDARKHRTQCSCGVTVDDDFAGGLVRALDEIGVLLGQRRGCMVKAGLDRGQVQVRRLNLLGKLLADGLFHLSHFDAQQLGYYANIDHVPDQFAQLRLGTDGRDQLVVRDGIKDQIIPESAQI